MEGMCVRCARLSLVGQQAVRVSSRVGIRSLSTSQSLRQNDDGSNNTEKPPRRAPPKLLIRKHPTGASGTASDGKPSGPVIRRTDSTPGGQLLRRSNAARTGQAGGSLLRRPGSPSSSTPGGPLLRRTGKPGAAGARPGLAKKSGKPEKDKRRRAARPEEEDDEDEMALNQKMDNFIDNYINPPMNPTKPLPYNPQNLSLDDFKADWPNTAMTNTGLTESVVQKVQWLARRLPHGYQTPEQIAEHYLRGNLTKFESEEEKQLVLKIASEQSAASKQDLDDGAIKFWEMVKTNRFPARDDPSFTSLANKEADRSGLLQPEIKGEYTTTEKQKFGFMQNVAKSLENNESFGPAQSRRLLDRVQALIPQARQPGQPQAKRAEKA